MPDAMQMSEAKYQRKGEVLDAEVGDELVALDVVAGDCFGMNEVAKTVWQSLAEPKSFMQLREELLAEYDVAAAQCEIELKELLEELAAQGLITKTAF